MFKVYGDHGDVTLKHIIPYLFYVYIVKST